MFHLLEPMPSRRLSLSKAEAISTATPSTGSGSANVNKNRLPLGKAIFVLRKIHLKKTELRPNLPTLCGGDGVYFCHKVVESGGKWGASA